MEQCTFSSESSNLLFFCYLWSGFTASFLFRLKITHQVFHTEKLFSRYEVSGRMLSYVISKNFSRFSFVFILFCVILFLLHQKSEISHNFSSKTWKCVWPIFLFGNAKNLHDILLSKPFEWYSDFNVKYLASIVFFFKCSSVSLYTFTTQLGDLICESSFLLLYINSDSFNLIEVTY